MWSFVNTTQRVCVEFIIEWVCVFDASRWLNGWLVLLATFFRITATLAEAWRGRRTCDGSVEWIGMRESEKERAK